jgi:hypothetical protein
LFSRKFNFIKNKTKFLKLTNGKQLYLINWDNKVAIAPINYRFAKFNLISGLQLYFISHNKEKDNEENITPIRNIYTNYTVMKGKTLKINLKS